MKNTNWLKKIIIIFFISILFVFASLSLYSTYSSNNYFSTLKINQVIKENDDAASSTSPTGGSGTPPTPSSSGSSTSANPGTSSNTQNQNLFPSEIDSSNIIKLYKNDNKTSTFKTLDQLGPIKNITIQGLTHTGQTLTLYDFTAIDSDNHLITTKVKAINYETPKNTGITLAALDGTSDPKTVLEDNKRTTGIKYDAKNGRPFTQNFTLEVELPSPQPISKLSLYQMMDNVDNRINDNSNDIYIGEIILTTEDGNHVFKIENISQKDYHGLLSKAHDEDSNVAENIVKLSIGPQTQIDWTEYSDYGNSDSSFVFSPNKKALDILYNPREWSIETRYIYDNENYKNYTPQVHGGEQKIEITVQNKNNAQKKTFSIYMHSTLSKLQALAFTQEMTDSGVYKLLKDTFIIGETQVPDSLNSLTVDNIDTLNNNIISDSSKIIHLNLALSGTSWLINENSLANFTILGFISRVISFNLISDIHTSTDYAYFTNPFYLSWLGMLNNIQHIVIGLKDEDHQPILVIGDPNDASYIKNLLFLESYWIETYNYLTPSSQPSTTLWEKVLSSFIWKNVFITFAGALHSFTFRIPNEKDPDSIPIDSEFGKYISKKLTPPPVYFEVSINKSWSSSITSIPSPTINLNTSQLTQLTVGTVNGVVSVDAFYKDGQPYWDYASKNINPKTIGGYYQNKFITNDYITTNNLKAPDDYTSITPGASDVIKPLPHLSDIPTLIEHDHKPYTMFIDQERIDPVVYQGYFIYDSDALNNAKFYYKQNKNIYLYTSFSEVLHYIDPNDFTQKGLNSIDKNTFDNNLYEIYKDNGKESGLDSIDMPDINFTTKGITQIINVNNKVYDKSFIYQGQATWDFNGEFYLKDIKYVSQNNYYTSLEYVPDEQLRTLTSLKVKNVDPRQFGLFSTPPLPNKNLFLSNDTKVTLPNIKVDGKDYSAQLFQGTPGWGVDTNQIKYKFVKGQNEVYFTDWDLIPQEKRPYIFEILQQETTYHQIQSLKIPHEGNNITVKNDDTLDVYHSILIRGKWYWNIPEEISKHIKYISRNGVYYRDDQISDFKVIDDNALSSVKIINQNIFISHADPLQRIKQSETLTSSNLEKYSSLLYDNEEKSYLIKDGDVVFPEGLFIKLNFLTFINNKYRFYSRYVNIPNKERQFAYSALKSNIIVKNYSGISKEEFVKRIRGLDRLTLFDTNNIKHVLSVRIIQKNGVKIVKTSDFELLAQAKYIGEDNVLYSKLTPSALNNRVSTLNIYVSATSLAITKESLFESKRKNILKINRNIAIIFSAVSLVIGGCMIGASVILKKRGL